MSCPRCALAPKPVAGSYVAGLYQKLRNRLVLVPSFGCYTPKRGTSQPGDHSKWPLHHWRGPGHEPLVAEFSSREGLRPTFEQFCQLYNFVPVEA